MSEQELDTGRSIEKFPWQTIPVLQAGDIHLWGAFSAQSPMILDPCYEALTIEGKKGASFFKFQKDRDSYVLSNGLVRILIADYLKISTEELKVSRHKKGKPYLLNDDQFFFNISNSGDCCVFAFSRNGEVGIDIERIRPLKDLDELIEKNFSPNEIIYINRNSADRSTRFFKLWTLKEAYLKAIGEGMRLTPDNLEFSCGNGEFKLQSVRGIDELGDWTFMDFSPSKDYVGTLAYKENSATVSAIRII